MRRADDHSTRMRGSGLLAAVVLFFPLTGGILSIAGVGSTEAAPGESFAPLPGTLEAAAEGPSPWQEPAASVVADATPASFQIVSSGPIKAEGIITSTSGGFQFPDGTVQTTAATGSPYSASAPAGAGAAPGGNAAVVVSRRGGDHATLAAAIDSLTDAGPARPYVIRLSPGVYRERIRMRPFVSIEGAGQGLTRIVAEGGAADGATVVGAPHASLRNLSVESTGNAAYAVAVRSPGGALTLEGVRATASGGRRGNFAIVNDSGPMTLRHVIAEATGGEEAIGVRNDGIAAVSLMDVTVRVGGRAKQAIGISDRGAVGSKLRMTNVEVEAFGSGSFNTGIHCQGAGDLFFDGVRVAAAGAAVINEGLFLGAASRAGSPAVRISGLWATATGGEMSRGATFESRSVTLRGSHLEAQGARNNTGLMLQEGVATGERYAVRLLDSSVIAAEQTVWSQAEDVHVGIGHSTLEGGPVFADRGEVACAATIDEEFAFHSHGCP